MKIVYQLDEDNYYCGTVEADESPLEKGVYLFPANTVEIPPPSFTESQVAKWDNGWVIEEIPVEEEITEEPAEPIYVPTTYSEKRQAEYPSIEEITVALWEGVVEERMASVTQLEILRQAVKAKYPKE